MDKSEELDNSIMTVRYKLVLVGDTMVGKTAILDRFINNTILDTGRHSLILLIISLLIFF